MPSVALGALPRVTRGGVLLMGLALGCATGVDFVATSMLATGAVQIHAGVYATPDDFLWCFTSYAAAAIVANLMLRRIADLISYRGFTMLGLLVAIGGALLCAVSNNIVQLSLALAVQGLGAGGLFAAARTLIQMIAAPQERPRLLWPFVLGAIGMLAAAPWITATLILDASWRLIFVVQAIGAAATLLLVSVTYPHRVTPPRPPDIDALAAMDWYTVLLLGLGALVLVHGLADLRLYTAASTPIVLVRPLAGAALMTLAFVRLHRHPDPWLNTHRLGGKRYLTGLGFYAIYSFVAGLWNYLIPIVLQLGLGFSFETTGIVTTLTAAAGVVAAIVFVLYGARLPGSRRWLALGYVMLAGAAWMLATRLMTDLSLGRVVPALLLQSMALPFSLIVVAKLTFLDTPLDDFSHTYQFKNIVRQVASAAGTGTAAQCLQYGEALARTHLVARVDPFGIAPLPHGAALIGLSQQIDQQAVLLAGANLLAIVAPGCLLVAGFALWQRWLR
ncbi:Major Facilitator Superfamily protein [Ralstonia sp. 25mfcol4.1]|uniref:MFS transporter n=1 Tax=Burkholderiaceae TaxID=119060 RepID=UPI00088B7A77|nr:MFS transporter [Ralstonia sp. 25mfcol4.1]SDP26334.1 Major Facilitator Superfamily protein [Ralstonia sp. 25mfcol4.1]